MMESLSKTLDTYTTSYVARRRKKRIAFAAVIVSLSVLAVALALWLPGSGLLGASEKRLASKSAVLEKWTSQDWDSVLSMCETSLQTKPMDTFYLAFEGLASFYKASELTEGEERAALIDQSATMIRKTLVVADKTKAKAIPRAELEYVLGKACYFKGSAYYDESAKWMEAAVADGYLASDTWEFLAVAWNGLGNLEKSLKYFDLALAKKKTDLLLIAAGKAYIKAGQDGRGESLLLEALSTTSDALTREKCRFLLSDIYLSRDESRKAQEQVSLVLSANPQSSEGHYRLGLLLQKQGDALAARAEWRKAVAIDPMNLEARQKLTEKL